MGKCCVKESMEQAWWHTPLIRHLGGKGWRTPVSSGQSVYMVRSSPHPSTPQKRKENGVGMYDSLGKCLSWHLR